MVVATGFGLFLCETVSGTVTAFVPPSSVSWGQRLNDAGSLQVTLKLNTRELAHLDVRTATAGLKQSVGIVYDNTILECGPILEQDYDAETEELKLTASGLWSIFDARKALPGNAPGTAKTASGGPPVAPTAASIDLTNLTLGSIGRELVRISIEDNPFTRPDGRNAGALNVVLPPLVPGTNERHYKGFALGWIGARLRELTQVDNGPDMRFRPRFRNDDRAVVEWVFETGDPLLEQSGPDWTWDAAVARSGVVKLGVVRSLSGLASRAWGTGNGQDVDTLIAWQTDRRLIDAGFPWTETDAASKQVDDLGVLQDGVDRQLADSAAPWESWSLSVRADVSPRLGSYLPGDWARINVGPGHPMIEPGFYRVRILAVDGDATEVVKLTVAPIQGSA